MNRVGTGIIAFFGVSGVVMVLVGRELEDRRGEVGDAASVFVLIGMIWTAVAIFLLVLFLAVGRSVARHAARQAGVVREATKGSDA